MTERRDSRTEAACRRPVRLAATVLLYSSFAFTPAAHQGPAPTFRSGVELVRLDVTVLDRQQQPVRDLTAADFRVTAGRRDLPIRAFSTVAVPVGGVLPEPVSSGNAAPARAEDETAGPAPMLVPADTLSSGRLLTIVMDDALTPGSDPKWVANARHIARAIVESLGPTDRAAVVFPRAPTGSIVLTMDRPALLARIDQFAPGGGLLALPPMSAANPRVNRDEVILYHHSVSALRYTIDAIAPISDTRKVLVYIGPGVPIDQSPPPGLAADFHNDFVLEMDAMFRAAQRANVVIYSFDPTGNDGLQGYAFDRFMMVARKMTTQPNAQPPSEVARIRAREVTGWSTDYAVSVTSNTGGRALIRTDNFEAGVAQMFADTSFYYLLAVERPDSMPGDGFQGVRVSVNRRGLNVMARRGFFRDDSPPQ